MLSGTFFRLRYFPLGELYDSQRVATYEKGIHKVEVEP